MTCASWRIISSEFFPCSRGTAFGEHRYRYRVTQGEVVEISDKGAAADIDALAKKYLGEEKYPFRAPGEGRVGYKIRPLQVSTMGS